MISCKVEKRYLAWLITRRPRVRVPPLLPFLLLPMLSHAWEIVPSGDRVVMRGEVYIGAAPAEGEPDERDCRPCTIEHNARPQDINLQARDLPDLDAARGRDLVGDAERKLDRDRSQLERSVLVHKALLEGVIARDVPQRDGGRG